MFDGIKGWLCANQNFMLLIYVALIVFIIILLWMNMKEGLTFTRLPNGRLMTNEGITFAPDLGYGTGSNIGLTGGGVQSDYSGDYNMPPTFGGKQNNSTAGFKADVDRPNFSEAPFGSQEGFGVGDRDLLAAMDGQ